MRDALRELTESLIYADLREPRRTRNRWSFGHLYPRGHALWTRSGALYVQQMQCLVEGGDAVMAEIRLRFLQPIELDGEGEDGWRGARPREIRVPVASMAQLAAGAARRGFEYGVGDGPPLRGRLVAWAERLGDDCHRLTVRAENHSPFNPAREWDESRVDLYSFVAAHTIVTVTGGTVVSLIDPPERRRVEAAQCVNRGCFPVLVGDPQRHDTLLASPTILQDYPQPAARTRRAARGRARPPRDPCSVQHHGVGRP